LLKRRAERWCLIWLPLFGKSTRAGQCMGTFVSSEQVAVQRGLAEFRGGRPVLLLAREPFVAMPIDGCDQRSLEAFRRTFNMAPLRLAITARRVGAWTQNQGGL
jgi:hypothetical protein